MQNKMAKYCEKVSERWKNYERKYKNYKEALELGEEIENIVGSNHDLSDIDLDKI